MSDEPNTPAQLRSAIDSGRTGDKVPYPDPAAVPLGTDDEAAGTPITPEQARMALDAEARPPAPAPEPRRGPYLMVVVIILVLVAVWIWAR